MAKRTAKRISTRSLKILEQHLIKAEKAFINLGLTQNALAQRLNLSRSTVSNFLRGKPIYKENFVLIGETLKLDWQEITGLKTTQSSVRVSIAHLTESSEDTDKLVTQLRQQVEADIETRCGTMRIFDMSQPIELGKIYTSVNILEKITSYQRKDIKELLQICNPENFERFNLGIPTERIPGKEAVSRHKKLLILGKPGAGKTTFLKHIAIECIKEKFQSDLVPFFVTLKEFAEDENKLGLLAYLNPPKSPIPPPSAPPLEREARGTNHNVLERVLYNGKALILLDGLDEVSKDDTKRVIREIESLTNSYPNNQYLMTCRIAAKEYTFEKFTEVEIADFNNEQIATFARNWFKNKAVKAKTFLERLEQDKPIKELVSNPLLLTLLCISFEELGDFPANRKELYEEGIKALLTKWDAKRGIQRDKVYKPLSIAKKEDLLSKIAWETFTPGDYFFKQDKAKRFISEYIRNLPGANLDDEALQGDSEIVLKNIEAQHGLLVARAKYIYSFSHLTFQEYFTAREIITVRQSSDEALQELVSHLFEPRWREVFLLAVEMSPNAERLALLIKQQIDGLLADDADLQKYLQWLNEKTQQENTTLQPEDKKTIKEYTDFVVNSNSSLVRVLLFDLDLNLNLYRNLNGDPSRDFYLNYFYYIQDLYRDGDLYLYRNRYRNLNVYFKLYRDRNLYRDLYRDRNLYTKRNQNLELAQELDSELYAALLHLKKRLPDEDDSYKEFVAWWKANGKAWTDDFRQALIQHCNIARDWQFNETQKDKLEQYYRANQFLTQCLHQECVVSPEVRQYIEETLLLPIAEIKPFSSNT